ncbi:hypothetical protein GCM10010156_38160 [Planobispora rosea]|uniref:Uncharacterized protein n=1 Tax=Planobispora rosea TaxID=35762 RepID=A0A8J3RX94_PLARO|nr:hypothetical protein [Planobispora rosea]GGS75696.1 hypothetical protein GCM10010156_38160 [Planobispora rosea]GIH81891.1 hypothetical protein Pro02_02990 [Planobispora rosea]
MRVVVMDAEVTLADVLSLRLTVDDPLTESATLVLRHRTSCEERAVALGAPEASGAQTRDMTLAVSLAPLDLGSGRWDVYLERAGRRTRLRSIDPGFSLDHLDAYALSRRTRAYRAYRTRNGFLALKVDQVEPAAEVRAVWFREGRFEVTGLLAFTGLDDDESRHEARLALRRSGTDAELTAVATVQGVRFHAALSLCDVVGAASEEPGTWEPTLKVDGLAEPLRLGSQLDDVDGKRRRLHYPAAQIDGVPIRPCYTADDKLMIEVGG